MFHSLEKISCSKFSKRILYFVYELNRFYRHFSEVAKMNVSILWHPAFDILNRHGLCQSFLIFCEGLSLWELIYSRKPQNPVTLSRGCSFMWHPSILNIGSASSKHLISSVALALVDGSLELALCQVAPTSSWVGDDSASTSSDVAGFVGCCIMRSLLAENSLGLVLQKMGFLSENLSWIIRPKLSHQDGSDRKQASQAEAGKHGLSAE